MKNAFNAKDANPRISAYRALGIGHYKQGTSVSRHAANAPPREGQCRALFGAVAVAVSAHRVDSQPAVAESRRPNGLQGADGSRCRGLYPKRTVLSGAWQLVGTTTPCKPTPIFNDRLPGCHLHVA